MLDVIDTFVYRCRKVIDFLRYDVPCGFRNLFRWFPVVWQDRNFDQAYIYTVLIHKLERQAKVFRKHGIAEGNDLDAERMERCVVLLRRLRDDVDEDEILDEHYAKWGHPELVMGPMEGTGKMKSCSVTIAHANVNTPEDEEQERQEFLEAHARIAAVRAEEKEELWGILRDHLDEWWF